MGKGLICVLDEINLFEEVGEGLFITVVFRKSLPSVPLTEMESTEGTLEEEVARGRES